MPVGRGSDSKQPDFPEELVRHRPALERSARRLCRNRHDAEDLVQSTLVRAWQARGQFLPGGNIGGWLYTILCNHHRDTIRRRVVAQVPLPDEVPDHTRGDVEEASALLATPPEVALKALHELAPELRRPARALGDPRQALPRDCRSARHSDQHRWHADSPRPPQAAREVRRATSPRRRRPMTDHCDSLHAYVDGELDEVTDRRVRDPPGDLRDLHRRAAPAARPARIARRRRRARACHPPADRRRRRRHR